MEQNEQTTENLNQDSKKKLDLKNKKTLMIIGGIIGAILLITIIILLLSKSPSGTTKSIFKSNCINLNDYLIVEIDGYDTLGCAEVEFDEDAFLADYEGKIKVKEELKNDEEYAVVTRLGYSDIEILLGNIHDIYFSQDSELSNGTIITLKWDVDEDINTRFNYTVEYTNTEYEVKDLEEFESFDPFENLKISYSGVSSQGIVNIGKKDYRGRYEETSFEASPTSGLSNGDTITVKFNMGTSYIEGYINSYGCYPSITEKEFVVEGLDCYASSVNEITEDTLNEYKKQTEDIFMAYAAEDYSFNKYEKTTVNSLEYQGCYLLSPKSSVDINLESDPGNILYIVYKVDVTVDFKPRVHGDEVLTSHCTFYYTVEYNSPSIDANNNCTANLTNCIPTSERSYLPLSSTWELAVEGYETIDELFTDCVQSKLDTHTYESSVTN